ncbi:MAG TPA: GAF domain-containing sensor histidine kinase [Solirubrobacteraceae bacterium]|nr:GAF domain-containing sensor histidine kinase [Solirubrobacteraceae bacterium]
MSAGTGAAEERPVRPHPTGRARARQIELEAAQRRVIERLKATGAPPASASKRAAILALAGVLFVAAFIARIAVNDPNALLANFYIVPIAILAIEFGLRAGLAAAAVAFVLVPAWSVINAVHVDALGYLSRGAAFVVTGVVVGRFSDRLRRDVAERRDAERDLALYADQLETSNHGLARSVERLEAFAEIARAVGGETELNRVLALILAQGREIVAARTLVMYLPEGDELAAVSGSAMGAGSHARLPLDGSLAGEVLLSGRPRRVVPRSDQARLAQLSPDASAAILVPLVFRGEPLGVLAGINGEGERAFEEEDEQLLMSVAASAATAVATARSVAAARLRLSVEAADQARARWARELHDETLQGLTGVRMVLSAGLAREDPNSLRRAADTADAHLGEEMRKLRDLIAELRPAALDDLGLGPAIESLAKRQAAIGGFAVELDIELESERRLGHDTETAIYRIVQEALSNAVKHAGAEAVHLRVTQLPDRVQLAVEDDGSGFDADGVDDGFGLTGMRERALLAGGRLWVTSDDGGPTRVAAVLPLPHR